MQTYSEKYWYLRSVPEVLQEIGSETSGLSEEESAKRLLSEGPNIIIRDEKFNVVKQFLSEFNNMIVFILFASAIISLISGHDLEFAVIMTILLTTVVTGFIQQQKAGKAILALRKLTPARVIVLRDSKKVQVLAENLVSGDVVVLERGMLVPADLRVIKSSDLLINESILTGESDLKLKHSERIVSQSADLQDQSNMVFCGTTVAGGHGLGVVVEKGALTELGKISETIKRIDKLKSPLQQKVDKLGKRISIGVIIMAASFFLLLVSKGHAMFDAMLLVGAVLVSGIPESFPLALTLSLANGVKRMARKNAIVKDLGSVETLGTTTVICTDKTGTLTQNSMVVKRLLIGMREYEAEGNGYEPAARFHHNDKEVDSRTLKRHEHYFKTLLLCNDADLQLVDGEWQLTGQPTEGALLAAAKSAGFDEEVIKEEHPRVHEFPFDPAHKYMIVINKSGKSHIAYMKGAAEQVLKKCRSIRKNNVAMKLTMADKRMVLDWLEKNTSRCLRVLAIATKEVKYTGDANSKADYHEGFILEGLVALEDPIRPDAFSSIKQCQNAGIRVVMITGDHRKTAESIGTELGLIKDESSLMVGSDLDRLSDEDLDGIIGNITVFARTTPEHKFRIVSSLQRSGEIVAMTGDGVNDAPALKKADIGIAMGRSGTDVARASSNMVLADDNFSTIAVAVKEGRTIYSNIRRFIYYLLTGNFTEVSLIIMAVLLGMATPLTAVMILFVNLVTSTFPAMALSVEPAHDGIMQQRPRNPRERLLSGYLLLKILVLVPILLFGTFSLFVWELNASGGDVAKARTFVFASLIMFELFHVFNARSLHSTIFTTRFFSNKFIFFSWILSVGLMLLSIYTAAGQDIFGTVPLALKEWVIILFISQLVIGVSELIKVLIKSEMTELKRLGDV